jgi:hypothetical protein
MARRSWNFGPSPSPDASAERYGAGMRMPKKIFIFRPLFIGR